MTGTQGTHGGDDYDVAMRSEVSGTVVGPSVQARDIHGGVHVHREEPRLPRPSQLPPQARLAGRRRELEALEELCSARSDGPRVAVVSGPAGIGKTALTVSWVRGRRGGFVDGQLFADLRGHGSDGPASPTEVLGRFLRALGVEPREVPGDLVERGALYRSLTADRCLAVVLDDAVSAAQVIPLLPGAAGSVAVVTSRWRLTGLLARGAGVVQLDRLEPDAAMELVGRAVGERRVAAEPGAARELVRLCGGFPLAACVAAARLAARPAWSISEMVRALAEEQRRLEVLAVDDVAVHAALDVSYRALAPAAARMYRLVALWPGRSLESGVAAAAAGVSVSEARSLLAALADANLLEDAPPAGYRFHDLIRLHARHHAEAEEAAGTREVAVRRVLDWYVHTAAAAEQVLRPYRADLRRVVAYPPAEPKTFGDPDQALGWLDGERANVFAAARCAVDSGLWATAWQLVDATWPLYLYQGHHRERLELERLGLAAARYSRDPYAEAKMSNRIGLTLTSVGELAEAAELFGSAYALWRQLGDRGRMAGSLRRLGFVAVGSRRFDEAITHFTQARDIYRGLGEHRKTALSLIDLGGALTRSGRTDEAITELNRGRDLLASAADPYNQARVLVKLGEAYVAARDSPAATDHLERALDAMRGLGSARGEADALVALAGLAEHAGRFDAARRAYRQAVEIFARMDVQRVAELRDRLRRLGGY